MKKWLMVFGAAALACCAVAETKTLTMATEATFPPYEFLRGQEVVGIDVELSRAVAARLGRPFRVENMDFDSVIPAVISGKATLAASGITITEDRKKNVDFSDPYIRTGIVVIYRKANPYAGPVEQLKGQKIGVQSGTTSENFVLNTLKQEPERFKNSPEACAAMLAGRCAFVIADIDPARNCVKGEPQLALSDFLSSEEYALAIPKGHPELLAAMNETIRAVKADGRLAKWIADYTAESDRLKEMAAPASAVPVPEKKVGATVPEASRVVFTGLALTNITAVAVEGLPETCRDCTVSAGPDGVVSAALPNGAYRLKIEEEYFSFTVAGKELSVAPANFLAKAWYLLSDDFYLCFLKKAADGSPRGLYLFKGLGVTLEVALSAILLGLMIGFMVSVIRSSHDKYGYFPVLNAVAKVYLTIIRGTPMVVQLLITYYIILRSVESKIFIAILAFGINSGAYQAEIMRAGIVSIDPGQMEAGRALGLSYWKTMIRIILPQAIRNVLPALGNEFIVLMKDTSIVGYIALIDLAKGGDIIRSQTYSVYLPYLTVAAVYLVMVMTFTGLLGKLERYLRNTGADVVHNDS